MPKETRVVLDNDPELQQMTESQIIMEVRAAFGAWADRDDITDDWVDQLRGGWQECLDNIYGPDDTSISI